MHNIGIMSTAPDLYPGIGEANIQVCVILQGATFGKSVQKLFLAFGADDMLRNLVFRRDIVVSKTTVSSWDPGDLEVV